MNLSESAAPEAFLPTLGEMKTYISDFLKAAYEFYKIPPLLLINEYEQPIHFTNKLIGDSIRGVGQNFHEDFDKLLTNGSVEVPAELDTSFMELAETNTLWGMLVNAGYLTASELKYGGILAWMTVKIPNGEVRGEFLKIVSEETRIGNSDLLNMHDSLISGDIENFTVYYKKIILTVTSCHDAKENAYHMLMLGMCVTLGGMYKITSNIESGHGRSDIRMESLSPTRPHIIIEFKQGEDIDKLKDEALEQIMNQQYYAGLNGDVVCIGVAHDKKRCEVVWERVD